MGLTLGTTIESVNIGVSDSAQFKVSSEFSNTYLCKNEKNYSHTIQKDYEESYVNTYNNYCYVKRCLRQKFKVIIGFKYKYNYNIETWGSGLFEWDYNCSYKPSYYKYTCEDIYVSLIPIGDAYYHVSYYLDSANGFAKFSNETNNAIIYL